MKKTRQKSIFGRLYSPYQRATDDKLGTVEVWYERYHNDPQGIKIIRGKTYYRIIAKCTFTQKKTIDILCNLDAKINAHIGDRLLDEHNNKYTVVEFFMPHYHFINGEIPEWFWNAPQLRLRGDYELIGEYLTLCPDDKTDTKENTER